MKITAMSIPDVLMIEPQVFYDSRGYFLESFNQEKFEKTLGRSIKFVQDNQSHSVHKVLRGLHYQLGRPQGKLVRITSGEVFDVAVDMRRNSPTFGKWTGGILSAENHRQLWIPEGFAHGFLVLSPTADLHYKATEFWYPAGERTIIWNDKNIGIEWPLSGHPIISEKDSQGLPFEKSEIFDELK